mgnify:CR=1 FL=1
MRDERPVAAVPRWVLALLGMAIGAQVALQGTRHSGPAERESLPPAPSAEALSLAAFGERALLARLAMLYLQAFDLRGLDYDRLIAWLGATLELDPRSEYPLFAAARVYAEVPDAARSRIALEFVYERLEQCADIAKAEARITLLGFEDELGNAISQPAGLSILAVLNALFLIGPASLRPAPCASCYVTR